MNPWILFFLLPTTVMAEANAPNPLNISMHNIISVVGPNWNSAGNFKAVLVREDGEAALYLFRNPYDQTPLLYVPHLTTTGEFWGTVPWLEFDEGGDLLIHSEHYAFGRNKGSETLIVSEHDNRFIVSGYYLSSYDSLDPDSFLECAIDIKAQTLIIDGQAVNPFPIPNQIKIENWNAIYAGYCYTLAGK